VLADILAPTLSAGCKIVPSKKLNLGASINVDLDMPMPFGPSLGGWHLMMTGGIYYCF
jgi:hypothetical protein